MSGPSQLAKAAKGKELLIFDFDGTIADTSSLHARAFARVLASKGIVVEYERIAGQRTMDALGVCFDRAGRARPKTLEMERLAAAKQSLVRDLISRELSPLPMMDEVLAWARSRYRMALVTSGSRGTVELALAKLGYADVFETSVFSEDVVLGKPSPDGFLLALKLCCVEPDRALVIEDSNAGFEAARRAGIDFWDVARRYGQNATENGELWRGYRR